MLCEFSYACDDDNDDNDGKWQKCLWMNEGRAGARQKESNVGNATKICWTAAVSCSKQQTIYNENIICSEITNAKLNSRQFLQINLL